ncbi:YqfQ family protein [Bacillus sp. NTK034]|uniref:YqfQ family protein n=1 Tax=Bacillus sp. NTK034 TaxID=2802176 RepID=UPI001FCFE554|nr:YqfQ family protein [Bacillus sp. NTK034]
MMPGSRRPMRGGMPPHPFMTPMQGRPPMGPMMGGPQGMKRGGGGGGLLSKILGKGNAQPSAGMGAARAAGSSPAGGGILQAISNPSSINGFLTNTQKVLNTAQQIGPMVQQYGPLVRNLPAMWKLYRGLKDAPEADEAASESNEKSNQAKAEKKKPDSQGKKIKKAPVAEKPAAKSSSAEGISKPKLYI